MKSRRGRVWAGLLACLFALGIFGSFFVPSGYAQERSSDRTSSSDQALAHQSREASGGSEEEQFKHSASVQLISRYSGLSLEGAYWLSVVVNFAIIALAVGWGLKKALPGMFKARTESIQRAMAEARKASEDANRRLSEIEARLSKLDSEIAGMAASAEKDAAAEEARIKAAAEDDARKIVEAAEQEIAAAAKTARRELKIFAADLAVSLAGKQIQVDDRTDQALVRNFGQQLSGNGGGEDRHEVKQ